MHYYLPLVHPGVDVTVVVARSNSSYFFPWGGGQSLGQPSLPSLVSPHLQIRASDVINNRGSFSNNLYALIDPLSSLYIIPALSIPSIDWQEEVFGTR